MEINKNYLKWVILPGHKPPPHLKRHYDLAYKCWREVWLEAFQELDGAQRIFSDDFTRQDNVGALFHRDECVGLTFFRFVDMRESQDKDDSYFKIWPEAAVKALTKEGNHVLVCSNFTIHRNFRKQVENVSTKDLLTALSVRHFFDTDCDVMTGAMRNNKSMNDVTYRRGAKPLQRNVEHHGVLVDLVGFYRDINETDPVIVEMVEAAWANGIGTRKVADVLTFKKAA